VKIHKFSVRGVCILWFIQIQEYLEKGYIATEHSMLDMAVRVNSNIKETSKGYIVKDSC